MRAEDGGATQLDPGGWLEESAVLSLVSGLPAGFPPLRQMNPNQQLRINQGGGWEELISGTVHPI